MREIKNIKGNAFGHTRHHPVNQLEEKTIDSFCVITTVFNPWRYRTRVDLYKDFEEYCLESGAQLLTVELALGERPFVVTQAGNPNHVQLRTTDELWHKERMINIGIERLPENIKYVAWVDADVRFVRHDWVHETIQLLQHYQVVQMFASIANLGHEHNLSGPQQGIIYAFLEGLLGQEDYKYYEKFHPGFAWAARRSTLDNLGGLLDIAILGSGDRHMAQGLIGKVRRSYPAGVTQGYKEQLKLWEERALLYVKKNVGYMPGSLIHQWHGNKKFRRYTERWKILIQNKFDPEFDLKRDSMGLLKFTERNRQLKYDIRNYFRIRNEDSIDP